MNVFVWKSIYNFLFEKQSIGTNTFPTHKIKKKCISKILCTLRDENDLLLYMSFELVDIVLLICVTNKR